jgi:hypothetical protein
MEEKIERKKCLGGKGKRGEELGAAVATANVLDVSRAAAGHCSDHWLVWLASSIGLIAADADAASAISNIRYIGVAVA